MATAEPLEGFRHADDDNDEVTNDDLRHGKLVRFPLISSLALSNDSQLKCTGEVADFGHTYIKVFVRSGN